MCRKKNHCHRSAHQPQWRDMSMFFFCRDPREIQKVPDRQLQLWTETRRLSSSAVDGSFPYIIGCAEALPILCVSDFVSSSSSSRERERERPLWRQSISRWNRKWSCMMHMITSTARRPNASTRSQPVMSSVRVHYVKTRSLSLVRSSSRVRVIDEWRWEVEALRSLVSLPWITQCHFVDMLQAKKIDQVDVYFLFEWQRRVLPLRTTWIVDILSSASLRDVQRQRCWKRGSGDGQRRWDYDTTERSFNAVSTLCVAGWKARFDAHWTVGKVIGGSR